MAIYDSSSSSWSLEYLISAAGRRLGSSNSTSHSSSRMESMVSVGGSKSSSPLSAIIPWNTGTLGYTACVGIVLLLIASRRSDRRLLDSEEHDGNESEESGGEGSSLSLYQFVFDSLSRLRELFISSRSGEDYDREEDLDGETFVVHQGSCHCGSIAFEASHLVAPSLPLNAFVIVVAFNFVLIQLHRISPTGLGSACLTSRRISRKTIIPECTGPRKCLSVVTR